MAMKYKTKCICEIDPDYKNRSLRFFVGSSSKPFYRKCLWCDDTGEVEYDFKLEDSDLNFERATFWTSNPDDPTDAKIEYEDVTIKLICSCGDEIFFGEAGSSDVVCSCGRVYRLSIGILKSDDHKGDMEFWEKEKIKKGKLG